MIAGAMPKDTDYLFKLRLSQMDKAENRNRDEDPEHA